MEENKPLKLRRGFAAMSPERRREIATQGGRAVQEQGVGHQWDFAEAQAAGRKGGRAFSVNNRQRKTLTKEAGIAMTALLTPWLGVPLFVSLFLIGPSLRKKLQSENPLMKRKAG